MNRVDLTLQIAEGTGLTLKEAGAALTVALEAVAAALARGEEVSLHGFGTFRLRQRQPREVCHPLTGERLPVPGGRTVAFSPASALRRKVNGSGPPVRATPALGTQ